jgi:hypothetical protein
MKRFLLLGVCLLALVPFAKAQEDTHFEAGAFADYFRSGITGTNQFGIGGRAGIQFTPHLMVEGDLAFDFNRGFNNGFTETTGGSESFITSGVKTLHGFFGPKYTFGHGPLRPFVEVKGGFVDFEFNNLSGYTAFSNQLQNLQSQNVNFALLYGGGVEAKVAGPIGVRFDIGDEVYFNNGGHQGLRVTFGPIVRF